MSAATAKPPRVNLLVRRSIASELTRRLHAGAPIVTDGGTGTELVRRTRGARGDRGEPPRERERADSTGSALQRLAVHDVHQDFVEAGAQLLVANTFTIARDLVQKTSVVPPPVHGLLSAARQAGPRFVALSLGPGGTRRSYGEVVNAVAVGGEVFPRVRVDAVFVETMTSIADADAAMKAAARLRVPIVVTFAVDQDGLGYGGLSLREIAAWVQAARPDAAGFNCGVGPESVLEAGRRLADLADVPLALRPAASAPGRPEATPRMFGEFARGAAALGARIIGGCCGAGPDHIRALSRAVVDAIALG